MRLKRIRAAAAAVAVVSSLLAGGLVIASPASAQTAPRPCEDVERDYDRIIDQYDQVEALPVGTPGRDRTLEALEFLADEAAKGFENCTESPPPSVIDPNDYFVCIIGGGGGGCGIPIPDFPDPPEFEFGDLFDGIPIFLNAIREGLRGFFTCTDEPIPRCVPAGFPPLGTA